ncbi:MAG TPA: hypothetical protein VHA70_11475 [Bauldia sp.]|nr:hypothetical protein [Bauldia sp.]
MKSLAIISLIVLILIGIAAYYTWVSFGDFFGSTEDLLVIPPLLILWGAPFYVAVRLRVVDGWFNKVCLGLVWIGAVVVAYYCSVFLIVVIALSLMTS